MGPIMGGSFRRSDACSRQKHSGGKYGALLRSDNVSSIGVADRRLVKAGLVDKHNSGSLHRRELSCLPSHRCSAASLILTQSSLPPRGLNLDDNMHRESDGKAWAESPPTVLQLRYSPPDPACIPSCVHRSHPIAIPKSECSCPCHDADELVSMLSRSPPDERWPEGPQFLRQEVIESDTVLDTATQTADCFREDGYYLDFEF
jgi:hypothetical protein